MTMVQASVQAQLSLTHAHGLAGFPVEATRYRHLAPLHLVSAKQLRWGLCIHALYQADRTSDLVLVRGITYKRIKLSSKRD
jgi:hypothetical protein